MGLEEVYSRIIELGQELVGEGCDDTTQADIKELMQDQQLNTDDLIEMVTSYEENSDKYDFEYDVENNEPNVFKKTRKPFSSRIC